MRLIVGLYFIHIAISQSFSQDFAWDNLENNVGFDTCDEPVAEDLQVLLYNSENVQNPIPLNLSGNLDEVNTGLGTKMIFHGWNLPPSWMVGMKDSLLKNENLNVITVDWSMYSVNLYSQAVCFTPKLGKIMARFLLDATISLDSLHLIGMSLGAQLCGFIGQEVQKDTGGNKVARITSLDAAGPTFWNITDDLRLSKDDAVFVDAIHTNAGFLGREEAFGTVDFYPNGGSVQPGCSTMPVVDAFCDHARSPAFFWESIKGGNFVATQCGSYEEYELGLCANNSKALMGYHCPNHTAGIYFLDTNSETPYARG